MKKLVLVIACVLCCVWLKGNDERLSRFDKFIKKDSEISHSKHPRLLFSKTDIPSLREKAEQPYFQDYKKDLIAFADYCLVNFKKDHHFPFTENPNFQNVSETLTMAYLLTGDKKYARKAIDLVNTFVNDHHQKVPIREKGKFVGHLTNGNSISFILNTIALVYDSLYQEMDEAEHFTIRRGLAYFGKITYDMAIKEEYGLGFHKNYRAGQMGALGLVCMALEGETELEVHEWLDKAKRVSIAWCNVAIKPDGVYPEGVTYLYYMLRNQLLFFAALDKNTGINYFDRTNLRASLVWTLWSSLPWKYEFDNFSDGQYVAHPHDMPYILQKYYPGIGDYAVYKFNGDKLRYRSNPWAILFGSKPQIGDSEKDSFWDFWKRKPDDGFKPRKQLGLAKLFPYGGMAGFRSGWKKNDMLLLAYATDYEYASHSQADRGQFNLYAYNRKWAIDSGYGNDAKIKNSSTPSAAHNVVLIDGKGQGFDPSMRQSGTFADITSYIVNDKLGFVQIDQKQAYDYYVRYHYKNKIEFNPVKHANRNILFVNKAETPPYSLVYDDICKDNNQHDYTWQMHTAPSNMVTVVDGGFNISPMNYKGKVIYAKGTGSWQKMEEPGFNIIRNKAGHVIFEVDVPETGQYVLWALAKKTAYTWGEVEVWSQNKCLGRFALGQTRNFSWVKFIEKKKKLHQPIMIPLKKGTQVIELRGVFAGYKLAKLLLTKNKELVPLGVAPAQSECVLVDCSAVKKLNDVVIEEVDDWSEANCLVKVLHPEKSMVSTDYYQPTIDPLHPRLLVKAKGSNPHFVMMVYPKEQQMENPIISKNYKDGVIHATIAWSDYEDHILINLNRKKHITIQNIETNATFLFCRFKKDGELIRLLVKNASSLSVHKNSVLCGKAFVAGIYENNKFKFIKD